MNIQFSDLIESAPISPGIYKMYNSDGILLYVGKAKNLYKRLSQYIDISKLETHKKIMRGLVSKVEWEITKTENYALILEEKLIKELKPKYNIMLTDGKMYPMLALTNHKFPRLYKFRGKISQKKDVFGPYPSVSSLNETIKTIQKVCKIRTCNDTFFKNRIRPCLLYQIGRCSAPCTIQQTEYKENINLAREILNGNSEPIVKDYILQMQKYSENLEYEKAAEIRDKISSLTHTSTTGKIKENKNNINFEQAFKDLEDWLKLKLSNVCVFDNSHLFGTNAVGSMIVFNKEGFVKSKYRHFKLKDKKRSGNDIAMMEEFISRAVAKNNDISLIIVDGGIPQWNIAKKTALNIPIVGVVKGVVRNGDEHFIKPDSKIENNIKKDSQLFLLLRLVRDEAHHFAITFHRTLRKNSTFFNPLDEIEGLGTVRKKALLNHFGSVKMVSEASLEALLKVPKLGKENAKKVYYYFH